MPNLRLLNLSRYVLCLLLAGGLLACSDSSYEVYDLTEPSVPPPPVPSLQGCADAGDCVSNPALVLGGDRPADVDIPVDYNTATRYPLVVVLHGRGAAGLIQALYFDLISEVDQRQFVLIRPDGTVSSDGARIWNATDACCATTLEEAEIDDVGYIRGLIEEAAATYSIDVTRVGLIGHSNGAFMAYTMGCEASDIITSIVGLAGSTFQDPSVCQPSDGPISVLTVHGTSDATVPYDGVEGALPSAPETAERYAGLAGCSSQAPTAAGTIDLVANIDGKETEVLAYESCSDGAEVELWTILEGPHIPGPWVPEGLDQMLEWMLEHPRQF